MIVGDTIFALSSGSPPAAIAVIRLSGPQAHDALRRLAKTLPVERRMALRTLRSADGTALDRAMIHWTRAPNTVTGEDIAELHLHGGRAVVAAVLDTLGALPGLRPAEPGEFTRRAFTAGRIDLSEAEGLADLLAAQTEQQRRVALDQFGGAFSRLVEQWRGELLRIAAIVEARIEYGAEEELGSADLPRSEIASLGAALRQSLQSPPADRLRDGVRVAIAGKPNAGKSTLLNALADRDAAIVSPIAGTTRDIIEAPVIISGVAFLLSDTAGLRESDDQIEAEGIGRARAVAASSDILIWLEEDQPPTHSNVIRVQPKADIALRRGSGRHRLSARTGEGMAELRTELLARANILLPREGEHALSRRQRLCVEQAAEALGHALGEGDELILAEHLRQAMGAFDVALGRTATEDMLDALFGQFCIGK